MSSGRGQASVVSHKGSPGVCFGLGRGRGCGGRGWRRRWGLSLRLGHQRWPRRHLVDWKEARLYMYVFSGLLGLEIERVVCVWVFIRTVCRMEFFNLWTWGVFRFCVMKMYFSCCVYVSIIMYIVGECRLYPSSFLLSWCLAQESISVEKSSQSIWSSALCINFILY